MHHKDVGIVGKMLTPKTIMWHWAFTAMEVLCGTHHADRSRLEWRAPFQEWDLEAVREGSKGLIKKALDDYPRSKAFLDMPAEFWPEEVEEEEEEEEEASDTESVRPSESDEEDEEEAQKRAAEEKAKRDKEAEDAVAEALRKKREEAAAQKRMEKAKKKREREQAALRKEAADEAARARRREAEAAKAQKAKEEAAREKAAVEKAKEEAEDAARAKKAAEEALKAMRAAPESAKNIQRGATRRPEVDETLQVIDLTGHAGSMSWQGVCSSTGAPDIVKTRLVIEDSWPARCAPEGNDDAWLEAAVGHVAVTRSALRVINPDVDDDFMRHLVEMDLRALGIAEVPPEAILKVMEHVKKVNPAAAICVLSNCVRHPGRLFHVQKTCLIPCRVQAAPKTSLSQMQAATQARLAEEIGHASAAGAEDAEVELAAVPRIGVAERGATASGEEQMQSGGVQTEPQAPQRQQRPSEDAMGGEHGGVSVNQGRTGEGNDLPEDFAMDLDNLYAELRLGSGSPTAVDLIAAGDLEGGVPNPVNRALAFGPPVLHPSESEPLARPSPLPHTGVREWAGGRYPEGHGDGRTTGVHDYIANGPRTVQDFIQAGGLIHPHPPPSPRRSE